jgi:hypothetical protein
MRGKNAQWWFVQIARDAKWSLQDARRQVARRA